MKYYAVKSGRKVGIFTSWDECQKQVNGYANAIFKSFKSLDDAKKYLYDEIDMKQVEKEVCIAQRTAVAYVDGSYDNSVKAYGYGAIIFVDQKKQIISGYGDEKELVELRNVAGEVKAAIKTMEYCLENKIDNLDIYYDYVGIENWFTGKWKANTTLTKEYVNFANNIKTQLKVKFIKVKAHTGNKYNEEVDSIAKGAIKEYIVNFNNNIYMNKKNNMDKLKKSKIKSGKIEPIFNIVLNNKVLNDTSDIMNNFKKMWKLDNHKLADIEDMKIEINLSNNCINFYVDIDGATIIKRMTIEGE